MDFRVWRPNTTVVLFKVVPSLAVETDEVVIPDGEIWEISRIRGNAAVSVDVVVKLIWDYGGTEAVLFATHSNGSLDTIQEVTGDGVKKLALVLANDSAQSETIGGSYEARKKS